jgi:type I restriction enzyme R subunit
VNPEDKFALVFNRVLETLFVERMEQNDDIFARFMNDQTFQKLVGTWFVGEVYRRLQSPEGNRIGEVLSVDGEQ